MSIGQSRNHRLLTLACTISWWSVGGASTLAPRYVALITQRPQTDHTFIRWPLWYYAIFILFLHGKVSSLAARCHRWSGAGHFDTRRSRSSSSSAVRHQHSRASPTSPLEPNHSRSFTGLLYLMVHIYVVNLWAELAGNLIMSLEDCDFFFLNQVCFIWSNFHHFVLAWIWEIHLVLYVFWTMNDHVCAPLVVEPHPHAKIPK